MTLTSPPRTRAIVVIAFFSVLSMLGSLIKLGTPVGSVAFDSSPGYFVAVYFSPLSGATVGALGHLASAATSGFPLGLVHLAVAILQAIWCAAFGIGARRMNSKLGLVLAGLGCTVLNGIIAPLLLAPIAGELRGLLLSWGFIIFLTVASFLNILLASIAVSVLAQSKKTPV